MGQLIRVNRSSLIKCNVPVWNLIALNQTPGSLLTCFD